MSSEELQRVEVLARVKSQELRLRDAAELLDVSYRQAKRLWKRYRKRGAEGIRHGNAGRGSNRAKPEKMRRKVLRLVRKKYSGEEEKRFGPTLAAEHLAVEDGMTVHAETLRRWMLAEGLWSRLRKSREHRRRRPRKEHFGELVQMDGSFHDWLEGRGPRGCLMDLVDDATGTTLSRMGKEETTWAVANVTRRWIEEHGVPLALYVDWKNVYLREPTEKELLRGEVSLTQFGRMCQKLRIRILAANSPQAKGRVERNHGTHQDRLIKKMRRKKIRTYEQANEYLEQEYLPEHNRRFAKGAAAPEDYHRPAPSRAELDQIFRLETERTISNDWVVRYHNRFFQIQRQSRHQAPARSKVWVCEWEDGRIKILYRDREVAWAEIPAGELATPKEPRKTKGGNRHRSTEPKEDHPWRRPFRQMQPRKPRGTEEPGEVRELARGLSGSGEGVRMSL